MASDPVRSQEAVFDLRGVGFLYPGGVVAIREASFSISGGETIALLGANGSGKSTLLKLLDGLLFAGEGSVKAFGSPLTSATFADESFNQQFRRQVGLVFQDPDVQLFSPTVRDELAFGPLHLGLPHADVNRRVADVAGMLGLVPALDRAPFNLSGGEKKKVAIGSILTANPDVLLLDEPTEQLDPRTQRWLTDLLLEMRDIGKTIVIATHDLELAAELAGRVVVFGEDHRVAAEGRPEDVLSDRRLLLGVNLIHERSRLQVLARKLL